MNSDHNQRRVVDPAGLFHTGIVVPDIHASMRELTEAVGVHWRPLVEVTMRMSFESGVSDVPMRMSYSDEGPHFLELIEGVPGTIWDASSGPRLHHIGYSVDDLEGAIAHLAGMGVPWIGGNTATTERPRSFSYHLSGNAPLIELVHSSVRRRVTGIGDD